MVSLFGPGFEPRQLHFSNNNPGTSPDYFVSGKIISDALAISHSINQQLNYIRTLFKNKYSYEFQKFNVGWCGCGSIGIMQ